MKDKLTVAMWRHDLIAPAYSQQQTASQTVADGACIVQASRIELSGVNYTVVYMSDGKHLAAATESLQATAVQTDTGIYHACR